MNIRFQSCVTGGCFSLHREQRWCRQRDRYSTGGAFSPKDARPSMLAAKPCASCHQRQVEQWAGSDHDRAMRLATPEFVIGNVDNTQLKHHGVTSRMSQGDETFFVETVGPDGKTAEFQVAYVFGYQPLQQYSTGLNRGHIPVLPGTWNTKKEEWFYASPHPRSGPDDSLH
ncbi:MAG: hypothetical protein GY758_27905 [Fuerstiella sp.]|nr:hypothetical protein [Fuerstiella sp.]MCP4509460.1 hypothetical protein [Fuerstiella sp.]